MPSDACAGERCRGRSRRGAPAIRPSSTRRRTRHRRNCTGRRASPTSTRLSGPRGRGTRRTRTGMVSGRPTLRRLFNYSRPYTPRLVCAVAGMVIYAAGSAGLAFLIKPIFDNVLPNQQQVAWTAWAIVGVYALKGIGSYVSSYLMADVGQRVVMDLRNTLYRHILDQSAGFFAHGATGRLLSRITNDVGQVQQAVAETAGDLARESLALVGFAGLMVWIDARLALVCMTGAPLVIYPLVRLGQRVRRTTRRSQEALEQLSHLSSESFTGDRIVEMLDTHTEVTEPPGAPALAPFHDAIEFRDVGFGYDDAPGRILRGVSFTVRTGQMVAIVGRSGAGKTTLVNLLPRFYDVSSGAILIDGVDVRQVTLSSLRQQIGIVTQDTVLFDDTIANNIA